MKKLLFALLTVSLLSGCFGTKKKENETDKEKVYDVSPTSEAFKKNVSSCYEIFPISFADSNKDGIGDLNGITNSLDYLNKDLGVDCIWITPIQKSNSYHKYDVLDYYSIDSQFGTLEDYKNLLNEAHKRNMYVLMDLVINHTSINHPWFQEALKGKDNPYHDYYVWNDLKDKEKFPSKEGWYFKNKSYYFASFWNEMPELNYENPKVREEIKNVSKYWLDQGVDGFRIDAAMHIYNPKEYPAGTNVLEKNVNWFKEYNQYLKSVNPNAFVVGEVWTTNSGVAPFFGGMDSTFDFELSDSIVKAINNGQSSAIAYRLEQFISNNQSFREDAIDSTFLTNHDQNRIMSVFGNDLLKAKQAANILFTIPGLPWIYYGEEIGMTGMKPDEKIREGFKWTTVQSALPNTLYFRWQYNKDLPALDVQKEDPNSMFNHYKKLVDLRKNSDVLRYGTYAQFKGMEIPSIYAFVREYNGEKLLVLHNLGRYNFDLVLSKDVKAEQVFSTDSNTKVNGTNLTIKERQTLIFKITDTDFTIGRVK